MITKLMNKIMLSCLKATELIEKKNISKINVIEEIQLRLHITACSACRLYEQQSKAINSLLLKIGFSGFSVYNGDKMELLEKEADELKNRIKRKIKE